MKTAIGNERKQFAKSMRGECTIYIFFFRRRLQGSIHLRTRQYGRSKGCIVGRSRGNSSIADLSVGASRTDGSKGRGRGGQESGSNQEFHNMCVESDEMPGKRKIVRSVGGVVYGCLVESRR